MTRPRPPRWTLAKEALAAWLDAPEGPHPTGLWAPRESRGWPTFAAWFVDAPECLRERVWACAGRQDGGRLRTSSTYGAFCARFFHKTADLDLFARGR